MMQAHDFSLAPLPSGPKGPFARHSAGITHIVVHYSWTLLSQSWDAARIHDEHSSAARGYNGIGYHFVILPDGRVQYGRPVWARGAHVRGKNDRKIGICLIGGRVPGDDQNGYNTMTPAQERSLRRTIQLVLDDAPRAVVDGHRDHVATQCPGFDVASWWKGEPTAQVRPAGPAVTNPELGSAPGDPARPRLRHGDRGAFVIDLQDRLQELGYALGRIDGHFGDRTREAVLAFQAEHALDTDSVVGPQTWAALTVADIKRPDRAVNVDDLRADGSRTIQGADQAQVGAVALTGLGTAPLVLQQVEDVAAQVDKASGLLDKLQPIVMTYWPVLVSIAVCAAVVIALRRVKGARVDDARKGRNLGR